MKCSRPNCTRTANRQQLCHAHYEYAPARGYVDAAPTRRRIELLLSRGLGWRQIHELTGLSPAWWRQMGDRVQVRTHHKVHAVPVPDGFVAGGLVPAVGTIRRIKALAAMGWPSTQLGSRIGRNPKFLSQLLQRTQVNSATAAMVDELYRELCMIPGPSNSARFHARRNNWTAPLAWDDIDDPHEKPNLGKHELISATERIEELQALGVTDIHKIAKRLGIKVESVERQLYREKAA